MAESDYTYQPPPHRVALVGDAWDVVQEHFSDGGEGPDGQPATVDESPDGPVDSGPAEEPATEPDAAKETPKPKKAAAKAPKKK